MSDLRKLKSWGKCCEARCNVTAHYGRKGETPSYCTKHKEPGMVELGKKMCQSVGCTVGASYGQKGKTFEFCVTHKKPGQVNLKKKSCNNDKCISSAIFGFHGKSPQYCSAHKLNGMINRLSKLCEEDGCLTTASFGYAGQNRRYCVVHKLTGMINLHSRGNRGKQQQAQKVAVSQQKVKTQAVPPAPPAPKSTPSVPKAAKATPSVPKAAAAIDRSSKTKAKRKQVSTESVVASSVNGASDSSVNGANGRSVNGANGSSVNRANSRSVVNLGKTRGQTTAQLMSAKQPTHIHVSKAITGSTSSSVVPIPPTAKKVPVPVPTSMPLVYVPPKVDLHGPAVINYLQLEPSPKRRKVNNVEGYGESDLQVPANWWGRGPSIPIPARDQMPRSHFETAQMPYPYIQNNQRIADIPQHRGSTSTSTSVPGPGGGLERTYQQPYVSNYGMHMDQRSDINMNMHVDGSSHGHVRNMSDMGDNSSILIAAEILSSEFVRRTTPRSAQAGYSNSSYQPEKF